MSNLDLDDAAGQVLAWCDTLRVEGAPCGTYRISAAGEPGFYAAADMPILRWAVGEDLAAVHDDDELDAWANVINDYQNAGDGRFGPHLGHHVLHAHGTAVNALCILGRRLRYPARFYDLFDTPERIGPWLSQIEWAKAWRGSHSVWGGPVTFQHTSQATPEWHAACLAWLEQQLEPETGGWPKDFRAETWVEIEPLGAAVHVWPLYRHHGLPVPGLQALTDRVLAWQRPEGYWDGVNRYGSMDALYVLAVALESGLADAGAYRAAVERYLELLLAAGPATWGSQPELNVHTAMCWVSSISYAQRALPDRFVGEPWGDIFDNPAIYDTEAVLPPCLGA